MVLKNVPISFFCFACSCPVSPQIVKRSVQEEDTTIVNMYAPNIEAPQYIRKILPAIKGEVDSNTIIVGELNIPLSP